MKLKFAHYALLEMYFCMALFFCRSQIFPFLAKNHGKAF